jgi:hypothetical protein
MTGGHVKVLNLTRGEGGGQRDPSDRNEGGMGILPISTGELPIHATKRKEMQGYCPQKNHENINVKPWRTMSNIS